MKVKPAVRSLAELRVRRALVCRLTPARALSTLAEAAAFLNDRGMLTLTPDSALPSLFGACHEEPYKPGSRGFGLWPKTKYPWAFELARRAKGYSLDIHRGKTLYLSRDVATMVEPLCSRELAAAEDGSYGRDAERVVRHLAKAGPALVDDLKIELGLDASRLRAARKKLQAVGAVVPRSEELPAADGGHVHTTRLYRWDQRYAGPRSRRADRDRALTDLVVAGVRAAVLAPEAEVTRWFSWRIPSASVDELVALGPLTRPAKGWLALATLRA